MGWRKRLSIVRNRLYLYPEPEAMPHTWLFWLAMGLVTLAVAIFCAYFILFLFAKQDAFWTNAEDFGIMDQAIWNTVHGHILHESICNILHDTNCYSYSGYMRFAIHFEPILFPISLLYLLWPTPKTLFVVQTLVVGLGAYPAFWLARLRLRNELAAVAIALLYLFYPAQQQATVYDFHAVTFTASLLLFTLYFMYTRRTLWLFVFAILAMACKEEIPLVIMMFGLWSMLFQRRWRSGLALALLGIIWAGVATSYIMPHFSPTGHPLLISRYAGLGKGPAQVAQTILLHPLYILHQYVLEPQHLAYLRILFAPAAFLPLLAPWVLVLALPSLAVNLFSADAQAYTGLFHYNAEIVPVLIFAAIEALVLILWVAQWLLARLLQARRLPPERLDRQLVRQRWAMARLLNLGLMAVLLVLVLFKVVQADYFFYGNLPFSQNFVWPYTSNHTAMAQRFIAMVPPDASVSAQTKLVPHLSHRENIYMFPYADDRADYILLDTGGDVYPFYGSSDYVKEAKKVLLSGQYGIVAAQDGFLLLKRGLPAPGVSPFSPVTPEDNQGTLNVLPNLPESFCANNYVDSSTIQQPAQVTFTGPGGSMDLVGYKIDSADPLSESKGSIHVITYWRVTKPITTPLQILSLVNGSDGKEYFASTDFPTILWCQTNTWKSGTIVQVASHVFGLQGSNIPTGLVHLSIALLPLVQTSSTIMDVHARLPLHIVSAPGTVTTTQNTHALQLAPLQLIP